MDLKPFEQLASWGGESYSIPRFQHLGRLLQCLNPNVTKNFGSISSLNHHLGWPTRCKIASNLLSLTWCQETCLTPHLPHPSTVPCDCYGLVNVDTFTSLLFGWKFLKWRGVMLEIVRETSLPNKKYWQALTSPKVKNNEFTPWKPWCLLEDGPVTFPIARNKHLSNSASFLGKNAMLQGFDVQTKNQWLWHPKQRCWQLKDPWFFVATSFLCKNSRGFWVWEKSFPFSWGGVSLHLQQTT